VRLGQRSTRGRLGDGGELIAGVMRLLASGCALVAAASAHAAFAGDTASGATSIGPGRIVCNAAFCQLGSGARPKERFRVIVSDLPREEIHRLRKCTGVAKPCIVAIDGVEQGSPMRIMATSIHWQD
jgi:hypothetical protein